MAFSSGSSTSTSTSRSNRDSPNKRKRTDHDEQDVFCPKLQYVDTDKSTAENLLECPICANLCIPPIHICKAGHHVCNDCRNRLRICPTCKSPYLGGKNFFLENYFEQNCFFSCPFMGEGCDRDMIQGRDLKAHQESCEFRPLQCICCTVGTDVTFSKYMDHLKSIHHVNYWPGAGYSAFAHTLTVKNLSRIGSYSWKPKCFRYEGHVFFAMNELKDNFFGTWVYIFGNSEIAKRYYSRISIVSKRNTTHQQKYSMSWEGPVIPIRSMGAGRIMQEGICLSTSKNFILKIAQNTQQISDLLQPSSTLSDFQAALAHGTYLVERLRNSVQNNTSSRGVDSTDSNDIGEGSNGPISYWTVKYELIASNNSAEAGMKL